VAELLWSAGAWLLILEGVLPLIAPGLWRDTFSKLIALTDGQLRFVGLASVLLGLLSLALIRYA
jgi:uncharacterized protein